MGMDTKTTMVDKSLTPKDQMVINKDSQATKEAYLSIQDLAHQQVAIKDQDITTNSEKSEPEPRDSDSKTDVV